MDTAISDQERLLVDELVAAYKADHLVPSVTKALPVLLETPRLIPLLHSYKIRSKNPENLRDKLIRKMSAAKKKGAQFDITPDNLFEKVNDLSGMRLLHLHTSQFAEINGILTQQFHELGYDVIEGPVARTWDNEYREYFRSIGVATEDNPRLYTSVHYALRANMRTKRTAEIQVRTLAEELWGEVDHAFNYPHESDIKGCTEQIKVLARVTSSCTRLVDSIFQTKDAWLQEKKKP